MKIIRTINDDMTLEYPYAVYCQSSDEINSLSHEFYAAFYWCKDTFGYEPNGARFWIDNCNYFWFETEEHRNWFILRWCE